ncbi:MAG TPA: hypothetical protein VJL87_06410, partial [Bdellovibrionota bacterium]|nr:hypothetical protein [Bdellovibrionota bacterium]
MRATLGFFLGVLFWSGSIYAEAPKIVLFSPQGTVKDIRQVRVQFSGPMVPLGDPRGLIEPFEIDCPAKGQSRWADTKNWIFDFEEDLPSGIECKFKLKEGTKTLSGELLGGQKEFQFSTGGPSIRASIPYEGSDRISEDQVFILYLDSEPKPRSVKKNVRFQVQGMGSQIEPRIVRGLQRKRILKYYPTPWAIMGKERKYYALVLKPKLRFPQEHDVSLIWGKGVTSFSGISNDKDQVIHFKTRGPFLATFSCERENMDGDCIPLSSFRLTFSSPINRLFAKRIRMTSEGRSWSPEIEDRDTEYVYFVKFRGPFPSEQEFQIKLPRVVWDEDKRRLSNSDKFPLTIKTTDFPPLIKFAGGPFGILEWIDNAVLPVTVRNIEPEIQAKLLGIKEGKKAEPIDGKVFRVSPQEASTLLKWIGEVKRLNNNWDLRGKSIFAQVKTE